MTKNNGIKHPTEAADAVALIYLWRKRYKELVEARAAATQKVEAEWARKYGLGHWTYRLDEIKATHKAVAKWAIKHYEKYPGSWKRKRLELPDGVIKLHTSPGKVSIVRSVVTGFVEVMQRIGRSRNPALKKFLRPQPAELNKELVIQEFEDKRITNEELKKIGLQVKKSEIVTIETPADQ